MDEKLIAKRLRELRKRRGKTQAEVAEALGIHQSLVSGYERGAVRMHGAIIAAFARFLKTSSDEILGLQGLKEDGFFKDRRFLRRLQKIDKLSRRDKQLLLGTLDKFLSQVS